MTFEIYFYFDYCLMLKYLFPFFLSFSLTILFIIVGIFLGSKISWKGRTSWRHAHGAHVFRLGGAAMALAFVLSVFLDQHLVINSSLYGVLAALVLMVGVGIWDDLREISWKLQLAFQMGAAMLVFAFGVRIRYIANPFGNGLIMMDEGVWVVFSALAAVIWIVLIVNSMNWLDGIDGLSGGVTFIGAIAIFLLSLKSEVNQPPMAILSAILAGTSLSFLLFNFHPSKILAGTAGSNFMGFMLAALALFAGAKIATSVLVMSLPVLDLFRVIIIRMRQGKSIFKPDKNHLHHTLLELGWSPRKTAIYFYGFTSLMAIIALHTRALGKSITFAALAIAMAAFFTIMRKKEIMAKK